MDMASPVIRIVFIALSFLTFGFFGSFFSKLGSKQLIDQLVGTATDKFIEILLKSMELAFVLMKDYRKNIRGFSGTYVFCTANGNVGASAIFQNGKMAVHGKEIQDWNVKVTFKDGAALRRFLFSKDLDILNSILASDVEVSGNLNYIYKFGFMVRELMQKIGIA
jgi:hypothetical protein